MADAPQPPIRLVKRTRVLTYYGPEEWVRMSSEGDIRYVQGIRHVGSDKVITEELGAIEDHDG